MMSKSTKDDYEQVTNPLPVSHARVWLRCQYYSKFGDSQEKCRTQSQ